MPERAAQKKTGHVKDALLTRPHRLKRVQVPLKGPTALPAGSSPRVRVILPRGQQDARLIPQC